MEPITPSETSSVIRTKASAGSTLVMNNTGKTPYLFCVTSYYMVNDKSGGCKGTLNIVLEDKNTNDYTYNLKYGPYKYGSAGLNSYFYEFLLDKYYYNANGELKKESLIAFKPVSYKITCNWQGSELFTIGSPRDPSKLSVVLNVAGKP